MDTNAILMIVGLLLLLWAASRFFNRAGTTKPSYDDKDIRSGGSIGGAPGQPSQRTNDDPNIRSGGSIGGSGGTAAPRTHDDPNIRSGGSIGGSNVRTEERRSPIGSGSPRQSVVPPPDNADRDNDLDERRNPFNAGSGSSVSQNTIDKLRNRTAPDRDDLADEVEAARRRDDDDKPPRRGSGNDDPNIRSGGSFG